MRTIDDIENYLIEMELPYERLDDGMWVIHDHASHVENIVAYVTGGVLNLRVRLFDLPAEVSVQLLRQLLEYNAGEMIHGAYGIEKDHVVLVGALEVENLDINEVRAMFDSFALAISSHHSTLSDMLVAANES